MRSALIALTDELRRLKTAGVKTVSVSEASVATLRKIIAARGPGPAKSIFLGTPAEPAARNPVSSPAAPSAPAPTPRPAPPPIKPYEPPPMHSLPKVAVAEAPTLKLPPPPSFKLPEGDKQTRWNALRDLVLNDPTCKANVRADKKVVLGVGTLDAKIMFVGEAPGSEEEIQGEPFVGPAGQLLTKMIQAMGLKRSDVYIGNIMNWRPQLPTLNGREQVGNRPPSQEEMVYCLPFLRAQIDIVNPDLLVALGSTAAQGLLGIGSFKTLGEIRGKWRDFAGKPLMVTYHPSYILRNQSNRSKRMIWEDLLKVMEKSGIPISEKQKAFFLDK